MKYNKGINFSMTYDILQELEEQDKAYIEQTALEGTCQLWKVNDFSDNYVVLSDNTVITQYEDNTIGEPIFKLASQ